MRRARMTKRSSASFLPKKEKGLKIMALVTGKEANHGEKKSVEKGGGSRRGMQIVSGRTLNIGKKKTSRGGLSWEECP